MRKVFVTIIIWFLLLMIIFLSTAGLFSCRTLKKDITRADSSSVRESRSIEEVWREITRELSAKPVTNDQDSVKEDTVRVIEGPTKYIYNYKETIREAGKKEAEGREEKKADITEKSVEKSWPDWVPWAALGIVALIGLVVLVAFMIFINRLLPKG